MDNSEKTFSIVPKMRGMIAFGAALLTVCMVNTVRVAIDFEGAFIKTNLLEKFVAFLLLFVIILIIAMFMFSPYRYRLIEGGVQIESLMRKMVVKFSDVGAVVLDIPPKQKKPVERVVLFVGQKAYFLIGLATDFDTLRDHVLAAIDPAIVQDRRTKKIGS